MKSLIILTIWDWFKPTIAVDTATNQDVSAVVDRIVSQQIITAPTFTSSVVSEISGNGTSLDQVPQVCDALFSTSRTDNTRDPIDSKVEQNGDSTLLTFNALVGSLSCNQANRYRTFDGSCNGSFGNINGTIRSPIKRMFGSFASWYAQGSAIRPGINPRGISQFLRAMSGQRKMNNSPGPTARIRSFFKGELFRLFDKKNEDSGIIGRRLKDNKNTSHNLYSGLLYSARKSSRNLVELVFPIVQQSRHSVWLMQWGQFVDHDIVRLRDSQECSCNSNSSQCSKISMVIQVIAGLKVSEPLFKEPCMAVPRAENLSVSSNADPVRVNSITAFLDGSNIYGSTRIKNNSLRSFLGGRMATTTYQGQEYLPLHLSGLDRNCRSSEFCFCFDAGDDRNSEQPGLTATHTMMVRFHNIIADSIAAKNPNLTDDFIFHETRRIVIAIHQNITMYSYLPNVLGTSVHNSLIGAYSGYKSNVDPSILLEFAGAAFRFGHSQIPTHIPREVFSIDGTWNFRNNSPTIDDPEAQRATRDNVGYGSIQGSYVPIMLPAAFFNPDALLEFGCNAVLLGLRIHVSKPVDSEFSESIADRLFQPKSSIDPNYKPRFRRPPATSLPNGVDIGIDLLATNIHRGRDLGLLSYGAYRKKAEETLTRAGLPTPLMNSSVFQAMNMLYNDRLLEDGDLYAGGVAEEPITGGVVGGTFAYIIGEQFKRLRDGDRFWFEASGQFDQAQLAWIKRFTLSHIIALTVGPDYNPVTIQRNAFRSSSTTASIQDLRQEISFSGSGFPFEIAVSS